MTEPERPSEAHERARENCLICGKHSEKTICDACSDKIRSNALARKKHENKGDA